MKEVYLDNAATTRPSDKAIATIHTVLEKDYGNPSSLHRMGQAAEKYMSRSRKQLADILMADPESIYLRLVLRKVRLRRCAAPRSV